MWALNCGGFDFKWKLVDHIFRRVGTLVSGGVEINKLLDSYGKKLVVYTSFDGDDMNHMLRICGNVISGGRIPLNPEMALGYHLSVISLGGSKILVMRDCLSLTLFSDEFWVHGSNEGILSEGIMAEIYLWNAIKGEDVCFVPDFYKFSKLKFSECETRQYLDSNMDVIFKNELENKLLLPYMKSDHRTVYIGANFANYKHLDWARAECYKKSVCPISPQNILSYYLYRTLSSEEEYLKDRLALLSKSDEYWLFIDTGRIDEEIDNLDKNTLVELYALSTVFKDKKVNVVDWADVGVPKYNKDQNWALTTKERKEVII